MVHFDSTCFGRVVINGRVYGDVLVVGPKIISRNKAKIKSLFGTDHLVTSAEVDLLLSQDPELVIIATGQSGVLRVAPEVKKRMEKAGVKLLVLTTPLAVKRHNALVSQGKKVNALIHTTC